MKIMKAFWPLVLIILVSGCYPSLTGTVIDTETGKPIEGSVVLAEWTKTKGLPGMPYTESYKVVEVLTDKEGKFKVSGVYNPFVNPPDVTVYKKGYVCWNSRIIFPEYENRTDFKWGDRYIFKLDHFKSEYSYDAHSSFISECIHSWTASEHKKLFKEAYRWEELKASDELDDEWKKSRSKGQDSSE